MSAKDQMPFFSDPPPWYYRLMAALLGLGAALFLYPIVMCLLGHEYWPVFMFGGIIFLAIMAIRGLLFKAGIKEKERAGQAPDDDTPTI